MRKGDWHYHDLLLGSVIFAVFTLSCHHAFSKAPTAITARAIPGEITLRHLPLKSSVSQITPLQPSLSRTTPAVSPIRVAPNAVIPTSAGIATSLKRLGTGATAPFKGKAPQPQAIRLSPDAVARPTSTYSPTFQQLEYGKSPFNDTSPLYRDTPLTDHMSGIGSKKRILEKTTNIGKITPPATTPLKFLSLPSLGSPQATKEIRLPSVPVARPVEMKSFFSLTSDPAHTTADIQPLTAPITALPPLQSLKPARKTAPLTLSASFPTYTLPETPESGQLTARSLSSIDSMEMLSFDTLGKERQYAALTPQAHYTTRTSVPSKPAAAPQKAAAQPSPQKRPTVKPPFDLEEADLLPLDLYVAGQHVGDALVHFQDDVFFIENPDAVLETLPREFHNNLQIRPIFEGAFSAQRDIDRIGSLHTDLDNFKISFNPSKNLATTQRQKIEHFDMPSEAQPSLQNMLNLRTSRSLAGTDNKTNISFNHDSVYNRGLNHFFVAGGYTPQQAYSLGTAFHEREIILKDEALRLTTGLTRTPGQRFGNSLDLYGIGLSTNETLLYRDDLLSASPVNIYVPRRAIVEIYKNTKESGELLYSRIHGFGEHEIDTRSFPKGSYDLEIILTDENEILETETQSFVKTTRIAPRGKTEFELQLGLARNELKGSGIPVMQLIGERRLTDNIGERASLYMVDKDLILEDYLTGVWGSADDLPFSGDLDASLYGAITIDGQPVGFGGKVNWTHGGITASIDGSQSYHFETDTGNSTIQGINLKRQKRASASISRRFDIFALSPRVTLRSRWNRVNDSDATFRYGPEIQLPLYSEGKNALDLKTSYEQTDSGNEAAIRLNFRTHSGPWNFQSNYNTIVKNDATSSLQNQINFSGKDAETASEALKKTTISATLRASPLHKTDREKRTAVSTVQAAYKGQTSQSRFYVDKSIGKEAGKVGGEFSSNFIFSRNRVEMAPTISRKALLAVTLNGTGDAPFDVLVNSNVREEIYPGETVYVELPPYSASSVSISTKEEGEDLMKVMDPPQTVVAYPNNILRRTFHVSRAVIAIGQLVDQSGEPLGNTPITMPEGTYYTDEVGFFDIELPFSKEKGNLFEFKIPNGSCSIGPFDIESETYFLETGEVPCTFNGAS